MVICVWATRERAYHFTAADKIFAAPVARSARKEPQIVQRHLSILVAFRRYILLALNAILSVVSHRSNDFFHLFQKYVSEGSIVRDCVNKCVEKGDMILVHYRRFWAVFRNFIQVHSAKKYIIVKKSDCVQFTFFL